VGLVTVRLAGILIVAGVAIGAAPTIVGVVRSRVLSTVAVALGLGGVVGLAVNVATWRRRPQRSEAAES
jgi:hypothetical protein